MSTTHLLRLLRHTVRLAAPTLAGLSLCAGAASAAIPSWTTYRQDAARSGIAPETTSPLPPAQIWQTPPLDGTIYGEPLVYGSQVYVASENDTIYSLDAATGAVAWKAHLGTPVPSGQLPCGDITPTVGITGTPVIDPATRTIYAVTDTWDGTHQESIHHSLVALDLSTGAMRPGFPRDVDPPFPAGGTPAQQLQRAALALDGSEVVIGYGGNDGDCGTYWGWLVGAPESGSGALHVYQADSKPHDDEGAIWGAGNGPAEDSSGDLYTATGNGTSGSTFDYGDSVLKLGANLELLEFWAPADWQELDEHDQDLGSSDPVLLPDGLAFEIGKQGLGVLLHTGALGGLGAAPAAELSICGGSWGGGIYVASSASGGTLYVTCSDGLHAVAVSELDSTEPKLRPAPGWTVDGNAVGPPILAGGLVWVASYQGRPGYLYGLDPASGAVRFESNLGGFEHFSTPAAGDGRLFAANAEEVTAFTIAATPPPSPTTTALSSSADPSHTGEAVSFTAVVSPAPDSGTVSFTDNGAAVPGCSPVSVGEADARAVCETTYGDSGGHSILATYSGDPYYAGSVSAALEQDVSGAAAPLEISDLRQSHPVWRDGRRPASVSAAAKHRRPPIGTRFSFSLDRSARVTFRFTRRAGGRRVGRRCLAPTRARSHDRGCRRSLYAGSFTFAASRGVNVLSFQGRLPRRHVLAPGRYTLIVTATDPTGTSSPRSLSFTIAP